jgi:HAD superfamily phosphoserine phosphatase-like hydrolase
MKKRIFVSSTSVDLGKYRQAVREAITELGAEDIAMETFGARDERPKEACLQMIRQETDIFVGIYAHRYGFIPNGDQVSITEAEYEAASEAGIKRLIYLVDDGFDWKPTWIDRGSSAGMLLQFKDKLRKQHIVATFTTPDDLAVKVSNDLVRELTSQRRNSKNHRGIFHQPASDWDPPVNLNRYRYKVVAFDLDGTLLRSEKFQFSWEAIWTGLGFSKAIQKELKREYHRKAQSGQDEKRNEAYREWGEKAISYYMTRHLNREKLSNIIKPLELTNNFYPAIRQLRQENFVLAIISGGIDFFLKEKVPDFRQLFDFVFINEFKFDPSGMLNGLVASHFDFQGKAQALNFVCERSGCTLYETVFVGDAFNDADIMSVAGYSIAYPPRDRETEDMMHASVFEDDLLKILPYILVE